jgi:hypothetical protein
MNLITNIICTIAFLFMGSGCFAKDMEKKVEKKAEIEHEKSTHEMFELNVGTGEGSFDEEVKKNKVDLYKSPSKKSKIIYSVPLIDKERNHPASFYRLFDDKTGVIPYLGIYSKERIDDFFKVYHKGGYYWLPSDQVETKGVEQIFLNRLIYLSSDYKSFFDKPSGKLIKFNEKIKEEASKGVSGELIALDVLETKWIKRKLWIRVKIHKDICLGVSIFDKPFKAWVHPYKKDGKPNYTYSYKGC